jgi:hypothetical protein
MNNFLIKKFKDEDDENYKIIPGLFTIDTNINKSNKIYKFTTHNNEEEIISTLNYKKHNTDINMNTIHDLRFFQVQTNCNYTYILINNKNVNKNIIKLFNEISNNIKDYSSKLSILI